MKLLFGILTFASATLVHAQSCTCLEFPFTPEPPCNSICLKKLTSSPEPDLSKVKSLDPGVALSIKVIAKNPDAAKIDFGQFKTKSDLENFALKSVEQKKVLVNTNK